MTANTKTSTAKKRTSIGARRSPDAEAAVLAAARDLISERGYAGFSVDEVARRAGAGKTTIYRWYPTKADLFIAIYTTERSPSVPVPDTSDYKHAAPLFEAKMRTFTPATLVFPGQRSCANAPTGRTYGRKRSGQIISKYLASRGPSAYGIGTRKPAAGSRSMALEPQCDQLFSPARLSAPARWRSDVILQCLRECLHFCRRCLECTQEVDAGGRLIPSLPRYRQAHKIA